MPGRGKTGSSASSLAVSGAAGSRSAPLVMPSVSPEDAKRAGDVVAVEDVALAALLGEAHAVALAALGDGSDHRRELLAEATEIGDLLLHLLDLALEDAGHLVGGGDRVLAGRLEIEEVLDVAEREAGLAEVEGEPEARELPLGELAVPSVGALLGLDQALFLVEADGAERGAAQPGHVSRGQPLVRRRAPIRGRLHLIGDVPHE